jgi:hypothetical protein
VPNEDLSAEELIAALNSSHKPQSSGQNNGFSNKSVFVATNLNEGNMFYL